LQQEHRQERDDDDQERVKERRANLLGRVDQNTASLLLSDYARSFREMTKTALDDNDGSIDQHADGEGESPERHNVAADVQEVQKYIGINAASSATGSVRIGIRAERK